MNYMDLSTALMSLGFEVPFFGIKVYISFWTVVLCLILYVDAKIYIETQLDSLSRKLRRSDRNLVVGALVGAILMVASIAAHEFGHAAAAWGFGYPVTGAGVSWWGAYVTLPKSYLSEGTAIAMIVVSLAGVGVNMFISLVCRQAICYMDESVTENTVQYVSYMNYRLAKLNLLPVLVLDGGKVVAGIIRLFTDNVNITIIVSLVVSVVTLVYLLRRRRTRTSSERVLDRYEQVLTRL